MERAEQAGLGIAVLGHAALLAMLTLGLFSASAPSPVQDAIEVSFVDEVALDAASPTPAAEPPPPAAAPELGPTEQPAPSPDAAAAPSPTPAMPAPTPAPVAARPPRESDARDRRRPEEPRQTPGQRARANRLADLNLDGLGADRPRRPNAPATAAPAAAMTGQAAASIGQMIARQVQPCVNRQHIPFGAEQIVTQLSLRINRDGSLAGRPRVVSQRNVTDDNRRYAQRAADIAVAAFTECSPLRGLPQELYDVPRGWSNFVLNYRLPG